MPLRALEVHIFCARCGGKGKENMHASIDRDGCIACGQCSAICPKVFRMADDGFAEVYAQVTEETLEKAQEAAEFCPVSVITVEE